MSDADAAAERGRDRRCSSPRARKCSRPEDRRIAPDSSAASPQGTEEASCASNVCVFYACPASLAASSTPRLSKAMDHENHDAPASRSQKHTLLKCRSAPNKILTHYQYLWRAKPWRNPVHRFEINSTAVISLARRARSKHLPLRHTKYKR